ncbi:hypothetical protein K0M31_014738 [Melipona bicolor]|uniref:Uncharacterized protein n=1 Tax=Melipona bicolor TaxID=60889 RepID=A0AA40KFW6_9HYME|nr:hypothetical protein K0M31_014738 [Melipona bicolor]
MDRGRVAGEIPLYNASSRISEDGHARFPESKSKRKRFVSGASCVEKQNEKREREEGKGGSLRIEQRTLLFVAFLKCSLCTRGAEDDAFRSGHQDPEEEEAERVDDDDDDDDGEDEGGTVVSDDPVAHVSTWLVRRVRPRHLLTPLSDFDLDDVQQRRIP